MVQGFAYLQDLCSRQVVSGFEPLPCSQVYLNFASRINADMEVADLRSQRSATAGILITEAQEPTTGLPPSESPHGTHRDDDASSEGQLEQGSPRKRPKLEAATALLESDLDWGGAASGNLQSGAQLTTLPQPGISITRMSEDEGKREQTASIEASPQGSSRGQILQPKGDMRPSKPWRLPPQTGQGDIGGHRPIAVSARSPTEAQTAALEEYSPSRHGGESPPRWTAGDVNSSDKASLFSPSASQP